MQRRKVIAPHERQDPQPEPSWPVRCQRCLIDLLPLTVCIIAVVGLLIWALTGCASPRPSREEVRVACGSAARAYGTAIERTRAGEISPPTFRAIDDGYAGVLTICRRVLMGREPPTNDDAARVRMWTARTEGSLP